MNETQNVQFEIMLHGAFRALGLVASPRHDGSGVTFACRCGKSRLTVADSSVSCPVCGFQASGEPWEIAKKCVSEKVAGDVEKSADEKAQELASRWQAATFHPGRRRPKSIPVYGIAGTPVAFAGDITVIEAQVKSGKTAFVGAAIASVFALPGSDCLGWMSKNESGYCVLHLDTEQSGDDHDLFCERVQARAQRTDYPGWLISTCATGFSIAEIKDRLLSSAEKCAGIFGGIHSVVIDGIADLVSDVNDPEAANEIIAWLRAFASKFSCPIIVVLHLNPITSKTQIAKARGHLGSQLYRKAAHVLRIEKNEEGVSTVTSVHARKAQVPRDNQPTFVWSDEKKRHVSVASASAIADERARAELSRVAQSAFGILTRLSSVELKQEVMRVEGCTQRQSEDMIAEMRRLQVITGSGAAGWQVAS